MSPAVSALGRFAVGLRLALPLFAAMALLSLYRGPGPRERWEKLKDRGMVMLAIGALVFTPSRAVWLMGHPLPRPWSLASEIVGALLTSLGWIEIVAARGQRRGISAERVRRGRLVNLAVLLAMVGAAWLTR